MAVVAELSAVACPPPPDAAYATGIWQAGGVAELHVWPGGFHGFTGMVPGAAVSRAAVAAQLTRLRRLLA